LFLKFKKNQTQYDTFVKDSRNCFGFLFVRNHTISVGFITIATFTKALHFLEKNKSGEAHFVMSNL
jgi:hypothetical protein